MLRPDGHVKVLDFGIAKLSRTRGTGLAVLNADTIARAGQTQSGLVIGTARYMSPEQA